MPEVDAAGSGYDPSATFGPSTSFGFGRGSENSFGSRGDADCISASPAPLGARSALACGLTSASRRRSAGGAGLGGKAFFAALSRLRCAGGRLIHVTRDRITHSPRHGLVHAWSRSHLAPEQRWLRRASLVRYFDTRPVRTFLLHQVEEYCGVMGMQAYASMRCGSSQVDRSRSCRESRSHCKRRSKKASANRSTRWRTSCAPIAAAYRPRLGFAWHPGRWIRAT